MSFAFVAPTISPQTRARHPALCRWLEILLSVRIFAFLVLTFGGSKSVHLFVDSWNATLWAAFVVYLGYELARKHVWMVTGFHRFQFRHPWIPQLSGGVSRWHCQTSVRQLVVEASAWLRRRSSCNDEGNQRHQACTELVDLNPVPPNVVNRITNPLVVPISAVVMDRGEEEPARGRTPAVYRAKNA